MAGPKILAGTGREGDPGRPGLVLPQALASPHQALAPMVGTPPPAPDGSSVGATLGATGGPSMEVLELFPRYVLKGNLPPALLAALLELAKEVLKAPERSPDASRKLAGQLALQLELGPQQPAVQELCREVILPGCERWIRHVIDRQPPQGRGPWTEGRYGLQIIDVWLNVQRAGDYNPTHTHGGSFSGVLYLQVPPQISGASFDGQLCFHGPEEWHIQSFRTGMAEYVLPVPGEFYVFPAWQPHSVPPFRGEGERWSLAFNVVAVPQPAGAARPAQMPLVRGLPSGGAHPFAANPAGQPGNVSLSSGRKRPPGF